jgi:hypothetical protein
MSDSTTTWTGSVSNLWTDAQNWTNGVPTYSTTPVINATSPISIDLNGSQSTNTIATSGTGTITFTDGTLALNGNFTMAPGQTIVMSGSTLTGQTITTSSGTATTGTITVTTGATIQFDQIDTTINFGPASSSYTNTVNFTDGGKNIPTITNLSPGDKIIFPRLRTCLMKSGSLYATKAAVRRWPPPDCWRERVESGQAMMGRE